MSTKEKIKKNPKKEKNKLIREPAMKKTINILQKEKPIIRINGTEMSLEYARKMGYY